MKFCLNYTCFTACYFLYSDVAFLCSRLSVRYSRAGDAILLILPSLTHKTLLILNVKKLTPLYRYVIHSHMSCPLMSCLALCGFEARFLCRYVCVHPQLHAGVCTAVSNTVCNCICVCRQVFMLCDLSLFVFVLLLSGSLFVFVSAGIADAVCLCMFVSAVVCSAVV